MAAGININKLYDFAKFQDCFSIKRIGGEDSFKLTVRSKCLKSWHDLKKRSPEVTFVQIINGFLSSSYAVLVKERCARVENRLASLTNTKLSTKRGRAYMLCANSARSVVLHSDEIESIGGIKAGLEKISNEKEELNRHCNELTNDLSRAKAEKNQTQEKLEEQINIECNC